MRRRLTIVVAVVLMLVSGACAPQSRVEDLETRVAELENLVNRMAREIGRFRIDGTQVKVPERDCEPGVAIWDEAGTLSCLTDRRGLVVDGYELRFPAARGCIGTFLIMTSEALTCDTPEHPFN